MFFRTTLVFIIVFQLVVPPSFVFADSNSEFDLSKVQTETLDQILSNYSQGGNIEDKELALSFFNERLSRPEPIDLQILKNTLLKIIESSFNTKPNEDVPTKNMALTYFINRDKANLEALINESEAYLESIGINNKTDWLDRRNGLITAKFLLISLDEEGINQALSSNDPTKAIRTIPELVAKYSALRDEIIPRNEKERALYEIQSGQGVVEYLQEPNVVETLDFYIVTSKQIYSLLKQLEIFLLSDPINNSLTKEERLSFLQLAESRFDFLQSIREFANSRVHLGYKNDKPTSWSRIQSSRNEELVRNSVDAWSLCLRDAHESLDVVTRVMTPPACAELSWPSRYVDSKSSIINDRWRDLFRQSERLEELSLQYLNLNDLDLIAVNRGLPYYDGAFRSGLLPSVLQNFTTDNLPGLIEEKFEELYAFNKNTKTPHKDGENLYKYVLLKHLEYYFNHKNLDDILSLSERYIHDGEISPEDLFQRFTELLSLPHALLLNENSEEKIAQLLIDNGIDQNKISESFSTAKEMQNKVIDSIPTYLGMAFDALKPDKSILSDPNFRRTLVGFFEEHNQFRRTQAAIISDHYQVEAFGNELSKYPYFNSAIGFKTDTFRIDQKWFSLCQRLHPFLERNWSVAESMKLGLQSADEDAVKPNHIKPLYKKITAEEANDREKNGLEVLKQGEGSDSFYYYKLSPWTYWDARAYENAKDEWVSSTLKRELFYYHLYGSVIKIGSLIVAGTLVYCSLGVGAPLAKLILIGSAALYATDKTVEAAIDQEGSFQRLPFEDSSPTGIAKDVAGGLLFYGSMFGVGILTRGLYSVVIKSKPANLMQWMIYETGLTGVDTIAFTALTISQFYSQALYNNILYKKDIQSFNFDENFQQILLLTAIFRIPGVIKAFQLKSPPTPKDLERFSVDFRKPNSKPPNGSQNIPKTPKPAPKLPPAFTIWGLFARAPQISNFVRDAINKINLKNLLPPTMPTLKPIPVGSSSANTSLVLPRAQLPNSISPERATIILTSGEKVSVPTPSSSVTASSAPTATFTTRSLELPTGDGGLESAQRRLPLNEWAHQSPKNAYGFVGRIRLWLWNKDHKLPEDPIQALQQEVARLRKWNGNEVVPARSHHARVLLFKNRADAVQAVREGAGKSEPFGLDNLLTNATQAKLVVKTIKDIVYGNNSTGEPSLGKRYDGVLEADRRLREISKANPDILSKVKSTQQLFPNWRLKRVSTRIQPEAEEVRQARADAENAIETIENYNNVTEKLYGLLYNYYLNLEPSVRVLEWLLPTMPAGESTTILAKDLTEYCGKFFKDEIPRDSELSLAFDIARLQSERTSELLYSQEGSGDLLSAAVNPIAQIGKKALLSHFGAGLLSRVQIFMDLTSDQVGARSLSELVSRIDEAHTKNAGDPISGEGTEGVKKTLQDSAAKNFEEVGELFRNLEVVNRVQRLKAKLRLRLPLYKKEVAAFSESGKAEEQMGDLHRIVEVYDHYIKRLEQDIDPLSIKLANSLKELASSNEDIVSIEYGGPRQELRRKTVSVVTTVGALSALVYIFGPKVLNLIFPGADKIIRNSGQFQNLPVTAGKPVAISSEEKEGLLKSLESRKTIFNTSSTEDKATIAEIDNVIHFIRSIPVIKEAKSEEDKSRPASSESPEPTTEAKSADTLNTEPEITPPKDNK